MKKLSFLLAILLISSLNLFAQEIWKVDTKESLLRWEGRKIVGGHWGNVYLKEGTLELKNNKISGGKFIIDMQSIIVLDLVKYSPKERWQIERIPKRILI